jgi:hypothetical protein
VLRGLLAGTAILDLVRGEHAIDELLAMPLDELRDAQALDDIRADSHYVGHNKPPSLSMPFRLQHMPQPASFRYSRFAAGGKRAA